MKRIPKQEYTPEFRELAVKRVKAGQTAGAVAKELGLIEQTLRNWVKAFDAGKLNKRSRRSRWSFRGYAPRTSGCGASLKS